MSEIVYDGGARKFADGALQASVDRILAGLPADHIAAAVDIGVDQQGIRVVGAVRLQNGWSLMGEFDRKFSGEWSGEAALRWSGN